jgi:hypothetical protein
MADRDGGLIFDAENQTVDEYLHWWLNDTVRKSVKPVTFENRERVARCTSPQRWGVSSSKS